MIARFEADSAVLRNPCHPIPDPLQGLREGWLGVILMLIGPHFDTCGPLVRKFGLANNSGNWRPNAGNWRPNAGNWRPALTHTFSWP